MEKDNRNNEQIRDARDDIARKIDEKIARLSSEENDFEARFNEMQKERERQRERLREKREQERVSERKRFGWKSRSKSVGWVESPPEPEPEPAPAVEPKAAEEPTIWDQIQEEMRRMDEQPAAEPETVAIEPEPEITEENVEAAAAVEPEPIEDEPEITEAESEVEPTAESESIPADEEPQPAQADEELQPAQVEEVEIDIDKLESEPVEPDAVVTEEVEPAPAEPIEPEPVPEEPEPMEDEPTIWDQIQEEIRQMDETPAVEPETVEIEPESEVAEENVEAAAAVEPDAQLMAQLDAIAREMEAEQEAQQKRKGRGALAVRAVSVRAKAGLRSLKKKAVKRRAAQEDITVHSDDADIGVFTQAPGLTFEKKSAILWGKYKSTSSLKLRRRRRKFHVRERRFAQRMADRVERADRIINVWSRRKLFRWLKHLWMKGIQLLDWAEERKVLLAEIMAIALFCTAAVMTFIGHITAYEYAYNGKALGLTKNKEDVYKTIDAIGDKLGTALDARVEIDKEKDITFREVHGLNLKLDSKDEVLNNLTYMQDLKVIACGIYKDDELIAVLQSAQMGREVLDAIKNRFTAQTEGKVYDSVTFAENVELRNVNVNLGEIENQDEVLEYMLTGAVEKKVHAVQKGQTFSEIAKLYGLTQSELEGMNPGVEPAKLKIGQEIILNRDAPVLTVQTVETATYTEAIPFETEYEESSSMYEGETSVKRNGTNGQQRVVATIKRNNGEEISREVLSTEKISDPVSKIVIKGTKKAPPRQGTGTFAWPIQNYRISSRFGYRWGRMHNGVDLAAPTGTKIYATDGGTVTYAGYKGSFGYLVIINHGGNYESYYAHCSKILVKKGDKVFQGQNIARVGSTGRTTGPHLHFEIRYLGVPKNPFNYI